MFDLVGSTLITQPILLLYITIYRPMALYILYKEAIKFKNIHKAMSANLPPYNNKNAVYVQVRQNK